MRGLDLRCCPPSDSCVLLATDCSRVWLYCVCAGRVRCVVASSVVLTSFAWSICLVAEAKAKVEAAKPAPKKAQTRAPLAK